MRRDAFPSLPAAPWLHILLIVAAGLVAYGNTLHVPLYFDDFGTLGNPVIRDFGKIFALGDWREFGLDEDLRNNLVTRFVSYATFALNYRLHQHWLPGYHLANLLIHLLNALQVYLLVRLTAGVLAGRGNAVDLSPAPRDDAGSMALLAALLFVVHPVQTNAVTYITQRFTSLCTLFFLLALLAYICSVLAPTAGRRRLLYAGALGAAVLAMYSKEIAFTLPLVIALYDFAFLPGTARQRWRRLSPVLLTLLLIPLTVLWLAAISEVTGNRAGNALDLVNFRETSRWHYLLTQARVLVTYLRLLLWPADLNFDYDYPLRTSLADPSVLASIMLLATLFLAGVRLLRRSGDASTHQRLAGFGVIWFFVTISVTSSIVPLVDLILEYHLYLPSIGLMLTTAAGADRLLRCAAASSSRAKTLAVVLVLGVVAALATATHLRNEVWRDKVAFWEDVVAKSPGKRRPRFNLAEAYRKRGRIEDALRQLDMIKAIGGLNGAGHYHLATLYTLLGRADETKEALKTAVRLEPEEPMFHAALGHHWLDRGEARKAARAFRRAQTLDPEDPYLAEILENLVDAQTAPPVGSVQEGR